MSNRMKLAALATALLLLAACGGGDGQTSEDTAAPTEAATDAATEGAGGDPGEGGTLVIWADNTRKPAMEPFAQDFGDANGVTIDIQEKQFDQLRDEFSTAAPAGEGPDIVVGAHDWLGQLVTNGVVAPIDLGPKAEEFEDVAIEAMTYEGQVYGLPYAIENIALFRNTEHVPDAPGTWEDLVDTALQLQRDGDVKQGLILPTDPPDPYHNFPIFTGHGGYVFGYEEGEGYQADDLGIDSEGGLKAAEAFSQYVKDGLIKPGVSGDLMQEEFGKGRAAFAITGPWALVQDGRGFEETGVEFEVTPLPPVDGTDPSVFVGVQGLFVSQFSENGLLAQTFLTDFMASEEAQMAMYEANGRPPALSSALAQVQDDNPTLAAFGESAKNGRPMPAIPEMGSVWEAWTNAYALIYQEKGNPRKAFQDAAKQIRNLIDKG